MLSDAELLRRYTEEKSEAAFAELVARYLDLVYSAAVRQVGGDAHRAKDVAQVVFSTLARKAGSLTRHPVLAGWLYTATQHAAAKTIRSETRRHAREQAAHAMQDTTSTDDSSAVEWDHVRPVLDDAMRELGERDREAVLLRFFARRPFAEIGAALQMSEDGARMRVERALDKLHALLAKRGVTSTAAALSAALSTEAVSAAPAGLAGVVTGNALSAATLGGLGLASGIFMKTSTVLTGALIVAATGTIGFQARQLHQAKTAVATLTVEREAAHDQLIRLQSTAAQRSEASPASGTTAATSSEPKATERAAGTPGRGAMSARDARLEAENKAKREAVERALAEQEKRRALRARDVAAAAYRPLVAQLGLAAPQAERLMALVIQQEEAHRRLVLDLRDRGTSIDETALQVVREQTRNDFRVSVQQEFGGNAADAIMRFQETLPVRPLVDEIARRSRYADDPLGRQQAEQLVDILLGNARDSHGNVSLATLTPEHIAAQTAGMLTERQLATCRDVIAETVARETSDAAVRWREITTTGKRPAKSEAAGADR